MNDPNPTRPTPFATTPEDAPALMHRLVYKGPGHKVGVFSNRVLPAN
jgi:hypothetical protein